MRKIKFRAKATHDGQWYYGGYYEHIKRQICAFGDTLKDTDIQPLIITSGFADWNMEKPLQVVNVDKNTVGQYTGIKDMNGVEIYEGDAILCNRNIGKHIDKNIYIAQWNDNNDDAKFVFLYRGGWSTIDACERESMEVVGNIYDNPEYLEGEKS